jgi:hypothetical protein
MQRRTILGAVSTGVTVGLAGCSSGSNDTDSAPSDNDSSSDVSNKTFEELFLRKPDLPKEGWNDPSIQISEESNQATWMIQRGDQDRFDQVDQTIFKEENISDAESKFDETTLESFSQIEKDESQSLDIGDESQWQAGTGDTPNFNGSLATDLIKMRNENIVTVLSWATSPPESHDIEMSDIEMVARTVQNKF